jgi:hypothetical protein
MEMPTVPVGAQNFLQAYACLLSLQLDLGDPLLGRADWFAP